MAAEVDIPELAKSVFKEKCREVKCKDIKTEKGKRDCINLMLYSELEV